MHFYVADAFIWLVDQSGCYLLKQGTPATNGLCCQLVEISRFLRAEIITYFALLKRNKHVKPRDVAQNVG